MTYDGAGQVYGLMSRVTALNAAGAIVAGPTGMYVSDALVKMTFAPELHEFTEIVRTNAAGRDCLVYQPPPTLKRLTVSAFEICSPDPELEFLLTGGTVLVASTVTKGYAPTAVGAPFQSANGFALEVWSNAIINGAPDATNPYARWVFPRLYLRRGEASLQADAMGPVFSGYGIESSGFGNGPLDDWTFASNRVYQWAREAGPLPATTGGYVAIPTQVP